MKDYLRYHWWKYAGLLVAFTLLWSTIFTSIANPNKDQRVNVLYIGTQLDPKALQEQIANAMPQLSDQPIQSVRVDSTLPDMIPYHLLLTARVLEYDILIFQESSMQEFIGQKYFIRADDRLAACFPDAAPYIEEADGFTLTFGFVLYDTVTENNFSAYYSGEQSCYLFVSPESVNFDTLNGKGEPGNDAALKVAQYLMEKSGQ